MTINRRRAYTLSFLGTIVALSAVGTASFARSTDEIAESTRPVPCEVISTGTANAMTLEAVYNAQGPANGTYRLSIQTVGGANSSTINQGGGFSVPTAGPISLGRVSVSKAPAYDIALTVEVDGAVHTCLGPQGKWT
ncbi:curli-like amyloid fiber formation chaperone CsgH [Pelagibacterium sp.]|uniref:curli-like amyloid fiber formation chaperone CsgH n=1 Tax=Pelagibacterium sp. TaxID=1967288 RepID=UPI003A917C34